ncbi:DNA replication licensing factor MCM5-like [Pyrus ussuriensis x Pyrus communis]|uniref:DNA replication licensing factor MCM5-like n=1 Tax=Pyrus ussuriensis x Pyrus communis TaxID=2448454 RepID=A0A5N5FSE1_9ROSA|nr:DNA replication licensing factor MCM5-like [Pyrus ussuriensis x Pyrus communis]
MLANAAACKSKPQAFFCTSSIVKGSELCTMQIPRSGSICNGNAMRRPSPRSPQISSSSTTVLLPAAALHLALCPRAVVLS